MSQAAVDATFERMRAFTSEARLRELRRKMDELRAQNEAERKRLHVRRLLSGFR
jgi:hypothetical protein